MNDSKIFVMGDCIKDLVLISEHKKKNLNLNMNYDLFTRDVVESFESTSGIQVLYQFLKKFYEDNNVYAQEEISTTSSTISEWRKQKIDGEERLYLEKHIGLTMRTEPYIYLSERDISMLEETEYLAIYNMSPAKYIHKSKKEDNNGKMGIEKIEIKLKEHLKKNNKLKGIILRTNFEEGQNTTEFVKDLFDTENDELCEKTVLLFNVNELRRGDFNIKKGVSWEQLLYETSNAIKKIKNYDKYKGIVICFNHEGCLLYKNGKIYLFYYCDEIEGDFVIKTGKRTFGPIMTMQFVITIGLRENKELEDILPFGLNAMRDLIMHGYTSDAKYPYEYMIEEVVKSFLNKKRKVDNNLLREELMINDVKTDISFVNLLTQRESGNKKDIFELCNEIVKKGPSSVSAPYLRLGHLLTFDRTEIEQLRSIYHLFRLYISDTSITKPFSICVFGQPGSGKSFAVKQIAHSLKIKKEAILEFNLSQMSDSKELFSAFHQIRDAGLKGDLPLVFFDEFDTLMGNKLGWLKYFLAPMQDGEFRENAIAHFIGRAIFVFAGGSCESTQKFKDMQTEEDLKDCKLPDFLSRIKGYIDINGPNPYPCKITDLKKPNECWEKSFSLYNGEMEVIRVEKDFINNCESRSKCCINIAHYLRRATLLRSILERKLNKKDGENIDIANNVFNAFMKVFQYSHGARSMEAIIQTSDVSSSAKFTASCIHNNYFDLYVSENFDEYLNEL